MICVAYNPSNDQHKSKFNYFLIDRQILRATSAICSGISPYYHYITIHININSIKKYISILKRYLQATLADIHLIFFVFTEPEVTSTPKRSPRLSPTINRRKGFMDWAVEEITGSQIDGKQSQLSKTRDDVYNFIRVPWQLEKVTHHIHNNSRRGNQID